MNAEKPKHVILWVFLLYLHFKKNYEIIKDDELSSAVHIA